MEQDTWTYQACQVFEAPGSTQNPFSYVFRVERDGSEVFRYTLVADTDSIKAHWPDIDPARVNDLDAVWGSLSGLGYGRVRAKIDANDWASCVLRLAGNTEIEE